MAKYCYESQRLKAFANQARVRPKRKKDQKKKKKKKNFKQIDEASSKWEFSYSVLIPALTDIIGTPKTAVCGIDKQCQVGCLISVVIIMMLLIDTGLSPTAAGPGETFDPCSLKYTCPWEVLQSTCHFCPWGEIKHLRQESLWIFLQVWASFFTHCPFIINCVCLMILPNISQSTPQPFHLINVFFMPSREPLLTF